MVKKKAAAKGGGRVSQFTDEQQLEFCKSVVGLSGVEKEKACEKFGISVQTYWNWNKKFKSQLSKSPAARVVTSKPAVAHVEHREPVARRQPDTVMNRNIDEQIKMLKHKLIEVIMEEEKVSTLKAKVIQLLLD